MRLTAFRTRFLSVACAAAVCLSLTALGRRSERVGLEFAAGTAWLASRQVGRIMLVDGMSGQVSGSVPLDGVYTAEEHQTADPLLTWQASAPELRFVAARDLRADVAVALPAPPSRLVSSPDGGYAFLEGRPARYIPRDRLLESREIPEFSGVADDVVVDAWGVVWALSLREGKAVPLRGGRAEKPVVFGSVRGTAELILRDGSAALFVPAEGKVIDLKTRHAVDLPATGAGLLPVDDLSGSYVAALLPPRSLAVRNTTAGSPPKTVPLGDATTRVDQAVQLGDRVYVPDLPTGRLLVYDLGQGREAEPIQIDDEKIASAGFEMFVKDDMLWVNELDGPNALVVRDGEFRRVRKYDEPERDPSPSPSALPSTPPKVGDFTAPPSSEPKTTPPSTRPPQASKPTSPPSASPEHHGPTEGNPSASPEPSAVPAPGKFTLNGPAGTTFRMLFSPDGKMLAIGSGDQITLWDMPSRRPHGELQTSNAAVAFSPDSKTLAVSSPENKGQTVLRFDAGTLKRTDDPELEAVETFGGEEYPVEIDHLFYTGGGRTLFGWGGPYYDSHSSWRVVSWDLRKGGKSDSIGRVIIREDLRPSPDGERLLVYGYGTAYVIGPEDLKAADFDKVAERIFVADEDAGIYEGTAEWSGDGTRVVTVADKLAVWSLDTGETLHTVDYGQDLDDVTTVAVNTDASIVAVGTVGGFIRFWDTATGEQLGETVTDYPGPPALRFSPDGTTLAVAGNDDGIVWILEVPGQ